MYHFGMPTAYNMTRSFHEFLSDTESNTTISKIKDVLLRENVTVSSDSIVSEILTVIAKDTRDMLVEMKNSVLGYVTQGALDMGKEGYDMLMEKIENDPKAMKILNGGQIIYNILDNMGQMMLGVDNGFTKVQKLTQNSMFKFAIDNTLGEGVIKSINDMGDVLKLSPEERMALENPIKQEQRKYNLDGIIDLNTYDQPEMPPLEIGYKFEKKEKKIRTVRK
jgi:hypothetical protein